MTLAQLLLWPFPKHSKIRITKVTEHVFPISLTIFPPLRRARVVRDWHKIYKSHRLITFLLLSFSVARTQLPGADARLSWFESRHTIARCSLLLTGSADDLFAKKVSMKDCSRAGLWTIKSSPDILSSSLMKAI